MRLPYSILLLVFCLLLPGCAALGTAESIAPESEPAPTADSFTRQVAAMPKGATQSFAESPFGPVTIDAGEFYLSGLGNKCRAIRVTRGTIRHKAVLCLEDKETWRVIPLIFENMP